MRILVKYFYGGQPFSEGPLPLGRALSRANMLLSLPSIDRVVLEKEEVPERTHGMALSLGAANG